MALLPNALSCHFRVPILNKRSPDRSVRLALFLLPIPLHGPIPSASQTSISLSLSLSLSLCLCLQELLFSSLKPNRRER
uniref:Uncharacterized protein n=1 Tax=Theropithecus gelada TaxID=9565 RepID=A0A8D2K875_THEGE